MYMPVTQYTYIESNGPLQDLMDSLFPPLSPFVAFFLQLIAIATLLGSKIFFRLNVIWLALFRISDVGGTPERPGDNQGNEARRNTQYGQ